MVLRIETKLYQLSIAEQFLLHGRRLDSNAISRQIRPQALHCRRRRYTDLDFEFGALRPRKMEVLMFGSANTLPRTFARNVTISFALDLNCSKGYFKKQCKISASRLT